MVTQYLAHSRCSANILFPFTLQILAKLLEGEGSSSARQALNRTIGLSAAGCVFSPGKEVPIDVVGGWEGAPEAMEKARGCWVGKFVHMGLSLQPSASRA